MVIERQDQDIVIRPSEAVNMAAVQKVIGYVNVLEIASKNHGTEEQAAELAKEINRNWWKENKHRFLP